MAKQSALSSEVRQYLENINDAPCFLERFLSTEDFATMKGFAKDFGGISVELPGTPAVLLINVFGLLSYQTRRGHVVSVGTRLPDESLEAYKKKVRDFLAGVRSEEYHDRDSAWCAEVIVQSLYDATTAKVQAAIARSRKE